MFTHFYSKKHKSNIFFSFLSIGMLAILLIDIVVFQWLSGYITEENDKTSQETLKSINASYENQLSQYKQLPQIAYSILTVKSFILTNGADDTHLETISEYLRRTAANISGIDSIILFNKESLLLSVDTKAMTTEFKKKVIKLVHETSTDKDFLFTYLSDDKYHKQMIFFHTDRDSLHGKSNNGIIFVVDTDGIQEVSLPRNREAVNPILIFDRNANVIASQNDSYNAEYDAVMKAVLSLNITSESFPYKINGQKKMISFVESKSKSFFVAQIREYRSSQEQIYRALKIIIVSTLFVLILVFFLAYIFTNRVYKPFGKIFGNILFLFQTNKNEKSGKDEVATVSNVIQEVAHKMDILKAQLNHDAMVKFLTTKEITENDITYDLLDIDVPTNFLVGVLKMHHCEGKVSDDFLPIVSEMVTNCLDHIAGCHCYQTRAGEVTFVCYERKEEIFSDIKKIKECFLSFVQQLEDDYQMEGCLGISMRCSSSLNLPFSYHEAVDFLEYQLICNDLKVIDKAFIEQKRKEPIPSEFAANILSLIKGITSGQLSEETSNLMNILSDYKIENVRVYLTKLIADVVGLSENIATGNSEHDNIYLRSFLNIKTFSSRDKLEKWMCDLFTQTSEQIQSGNQNMAWQSIADAIELIDQHYSDCNLTLEMVADKVHLSGSYFSKLFNSYTGKTFPDYINQLRLLHAKIMILEESRLSINEIARKSGFSSPSYFAASFKKQYGFSPSQMRKSIDKIEIGPDERVLPS